MPKDRRDCTCQCHEPGVRMMHVAACCTINRDRVWSQYKSLSKKGCCSKHPIDMSRDVWMPMARTWKLRVPEIKTIIWEIKKERADA